MYNFLRSLCVSTKAYSTAHTICNENAIANKHIQGDHAGLGNIKIV